MASALTLENIDYAGRDAGEIVQSLIGDTTFAAVVQPTFKSGFKSKAFFHETSVQAVIGVDTGCDVPTEAGSATLTQIPVELCRLQAGPILLCHDDLLNTNLESQYGSGEAGTRIDQTAWFDNFLELLKESTNDQVSTLILYGDVSGGSGNNTLCDGIFNDLEDRNPANIITSNTAALDSADPSAAESGGFQLNVAGQMLRLIQQLDPKLRYDSRVRGKGMLFASPLIFDNYQKLQQRINGNGGTTPNITDAAIPRIGGFEIRVLPHLNDYDMFFTTGDNILVFTDLEDDWNTVQTIDKNPIDHSRKITAIMRWVMSPRVRNPQLMTLSRAA